MIRNRIGVVCSAKEAADFLRSKYGINQGVGVACVRDYPIHDLATARYSLAVLRRNFQHGLHKPDEYAAINTRIRRAIAKFELGAGS